MKPSLLSLQPISSLLISIVLFLLPAQGAETTVTYAIPNGTSYLGIPLLRPAVMKGRVNVVSAPDRLKVTLSEHSNLPANDRYFLEITASPRDPTLEGERWNLWAAGTTITFPQAEVHLKLDHSGNTRSDLPSNLEGCSFSVYPHWTLSSVFGGGSTPSNLRPARLIASADRVTLERAGATSTYYLEQATGFPHGRWRNTRGVHSDPCIDPGSGLILERRGQTFRFTLAGEVRRHLLRRPLTAGINLLSLPSLTTSSIGDLQLNQQGWNPDDELRIWRGSSLRRYKWNGGDGKWIGLDSILGLNPEQAPLLQPTSALLLKKCAADPDFALRPIP
jgi:hypothetical protein